eukprot:365091-Chlamydomonas_euryale.AAC.16
MQHGTPLCHTIERANDGCTAGHHARRPWNISWNSVEKRGGAEAPQVGVTGASRPAWRSAVNFSGSGDPGLPWSNLGSRNIFIHFEALTQALRMC